jgi:anti-sigma-K factor RskA
MTKDTHIIDLIPAYVLDCLEEHEESLVAEHLAACSHCRAELRVHQEVAAQLAYSTPQMDPPATVKVRLLARVQARKPAQRKSERIANNWLEDLRQTFLPLFARHLSPVWALISLLLILALTASNVLLWGRVNQLRSESRPMQVVALQGTDIVPRASGLIVISRDADHGTLVVDELPVLDESQEYQLWLIRDGQRTSGALFSVSEDGYSNKWIDAPEPLTNYTSFGVTIEPAGGSPGPTGDKVLGGDS